MNRLNKKLVQRALSPLSVGSFSLEEALLKNMRLCLGRAGSFSIGAFLCFYFLVDEEDGVIADCKFQIYGPPLFVAAADIAAELVVFKNYMQAKRLSAELIEKQVQDPQRKERPFPKEAASFVNLVLEAIDEAAEHCMDIPIEDLYIAPPTLESGERFVYPGWELLTDLQKKEIIAEMIARDIQPYIELDAGGVEVLKVEENRVWIAYSGNCTSCYSATGATLDAIGNALRTKIYPDLMVIPDMSVLK